MSMLENKMPMVVQLMDEMNDKMLEKDGIMKWVDKIKVDVETIDEMIEKLTIKKRKIITNNMFAKLKEIKINPEEIKFEDLKVGDRFIEVCWDYRDDDYRIFLMRIDKTKLGTIYIQFQGNDELKELGHFSDEGEDTDKFTAKDYKNSFLYRVEG